MNSMNYQYQHYQHQHYLYQYYLYQTSCSNMYSAINSRDWAEGEIAYMRGHHSFNDQEWKQLEQTPKFSSGATNHPVIILKKGRPTQAGQFYLICTVSAYSSGPENNYRAPWKQHWHQNKEKNNFRAFSGTEKVDNGYKHLQLEPGQKMPKARTSWVHTSNTYIVPATVLGRFNKSPVQLRMTPESLSDIFGHISVSCRHWARFMGDWRICCVAGQPAPAAAPREDAVTKVVAAATGAPSVKTNTHVAEVKETSASKPVSQRPAANTQKQSWSKIGQGGGITAAPQQTLQVSKRVLGNAASRITSQTCKATAWAKPAGQPLVCNLV